MIDTQSQLKSAFPTQPPPYSGYIWWQKRSSGLYATHVTNSYRRDGKVYHDGDYLGKVIDRDECLFYHRKKGFFNFSLENGYIPRPDLTISGISQERVTLRYGDIWVFDQIIKKSTLISIFTEIVPDESDTLLTLVANKLSNPNQPYDNVAHWYDRSYAQIIYPKAIISSCGISRFLHKLGQDYSYMLFYINYLNFIYS
jgi:hypothetical protein